MQVPYISLVPSTEQVTQRCNSSCLYSVGNTFGISEGAPKVVRDFSSYSTYRTINWIVHATFKQQLHIS